MSRKEQKEPYEIASEICADVRKAKRCACWDKFDGNDWRQMLGEHPELVPMADACHAWRKLDACDWRNLICEQPVMIKAYQRDRRVEMSAGDWLEILKRHPRFLDICPAAKAPQPNEENYGKYFTFVDWLELLAEQPQLEDKAPWDSEKAGDEQDETVEAWLKLIVAQPYFSGRFDWSRAKNCTDGEIWKDLLLQNQGHEKYCPWDRLPPIEWWPLFKYCPQYFEKCSCPADVPPRAWAYLLCLRPELSERFTRWGQLTVNEWASLLQKQPQLENVCPCLDKVRELQEDFFCTEGLQFLCGDEVMDIIADMDFQQYRLEHIMEEFQSVMADFADAVDDRCEDGEE